MEKDKALEVAQAGIDALREDQNINGAFRACLPDVFSRLDCEREAAADIVTFADCGLRIEPLSDSVPSHILGIPTMKGELGAVIDRVNQKLQVLMSLLDGNTYGEKVVAEIADILRAHYRAEELESTGRYVAVGSTVKLYSEVVGRMRSNSMAKRSARALNKQSHKF